MKYYKLLFLLLISINFHGQESIKGCVVDVHSKEPLAFVNIRFNHDPFLVITSDIDGRFSFISKERIHSLNLYYVGYKPKEIQLDAFTSRTLLIKLEPSNIVLQEIIITAGENPANRIIRKVIENKALNNPENISSFRYLCYNKTIFDFKETDTLHTEQLKVDSVLKGGHAMIMESITERKYLKPDLSEEHVLATKVSGFKHPNFATLATDIQPFSFYKDVLPILDINYLNPISKGSLNKYDFNLVDTLYQKGDTVFIISFNPKANKNFEGLKGLLYINTNLYAIQNVIAEPYEKGFIDIKIQQQYELLESKQWFPKQLNFDLTILKYPSPSLGLRMNGKSYIDSIQLFPGLRKRDFSPASVTIDTEASEKDSTFWNGRRKESLESKDKTTYRVIDSLGAEGNSESLMFLMQKVPRGRVPFKFLDIDISKIILLNKYEGQRFGLGLYTNEKVLKWLSIGGFFGYGIKDREWKYGGDVTWKLHKKNELEIKASYQNNLMETGRNGKEVFEIYSYNFRNIIASRMDQFEQKSISVSFRALRYAKVNVSFNHAYINPKYDYAFQSTNAPDAIKSYTNTDIRINVRYAYKEKLVESLNQIISKGTKYPVLRISYTRGLKDVYGSGFEYNKIEARLEQTIFTKNLGETKFRLEAAYADKPLPYGLLFTGEGAYNKELFIVVPNYFQTMLPYEFLSDQSFDVFFSHNFGSLLFKTKKFKPGLTLQHNMSWGSLSHKENHQSVSFSTKERGYYESGLIVDNILRINYLNVAYAGFGVGVFYRYGPYAYPEISDNLFYKLSFTFSTK